MLYFHALFTLPHIKSASNLALYYCTMFSLTVALWPSSISLRIHEHAVCLRSHFRFICHFSVLPPADTPHYSRVQLHFSSFRFFPAFDGRIFTAFAHFQHTMVPFCRLLLSFRLPHTVCSCVPSYFGSFCSLTTFDSHVLAAFALSPHSCSPPVPPVLAYDRFWQLLPIPSIRWSNFGSFSSATSPNGRILAAFALSTYSDILPYLLFSCAIEFRQPLLTDSI